MDILALTSLEVTGFRTFRHLIIPRLGAVNLIVGRNNAGKTCVLEAVQIYARRASPEVLHSVLSARDEIGRVARDPDTQESSALRRRREPDLSEVELPVGLFHNRANPLLTGQVIEIGPVDDIEKRLTLGMNQYSTITNDDGSVVRRIVEKPGEAPDDSLQLRWTVTFGRDRTISYPYQPGPRSRVVVPQNGRELRCTYTRSTGVSKLALGAMWDLALEQAQDDEVIRGLRIIAPEVERLNLVGDTDRIPIVTVKGLQYPVPLRSLGEGMYRLLGILVSLVSADHGILLIDEIDTGLHYSVQTEMWRLVFEMARKLDIQVFATTHSWDCISAFQRAAQTSEAEGILVRLQHTREETVATEFDEDELEVATRRQIEVR